MSRIFLAFLVLILAACAPGGQPAPADELPTQAPSRTPGGPTLTPVSFIPPESTSVQASELLRFEGEGPGQGGPIRLDSETTLRIHWQQFDEQVFQVFVVNTDPNQTDPRYKKVSIALSAVPSIGYTDYLLIPGEYLLMVETAAGKWTVWVESIRP
jgi:hypothetical protein